MTTLKKHLNFNIKNLVINAAFCFFCLNITASPWQDFNDFILKYKIESTNSICLKEKIYLNVKTESLGELFSEIKKSLLKNIFNEACELSLIDLSNYIKNFSYSRKSVVGFQSKVDNLFFQTSRARYEKENNYYFKTSNTLNNFSYQFQVKKFNDEVVFDESYIAFLIKDNIVLKIGKESKWWSPSNETSLIISNSSRPMPGITLANYKHISSNLPLIKYLGKIDYEVFINKLERKRHIPNAILFGNKLSFRPHQRLNISLFRVAQFGGKGRSINSSMLKNMLLGKDTINSNLDFEDQPGNQIAGIDFNLIFSKNMNGRFYGQLLGEDGLDPIIDDRWIGAIFPSKRFYLFGFERGYKRNGSNFSINLEHINTDSGFKNITYNHNLYKSGYRYKGFPIGANIDADSHSSIFSISKYNASYFLKLKYRKFNLNQNNSETTIWGNENIIGDELSFTVAKNFKNGFNFELISLFRQYVQYEKNNKPSIFFKIEKHI